MDDNILDIIRKTEQKAEEIKLNALREGRDMIKASQEVSSKEEQEANLTCRDIYNKEISAKTKEIEVQISQKSFENGKKLDLIRENAEKNISKAAKHIVERIISNGNS